MFWKRWKKPRSSNLKENRIDALVTRLEEKGRIDQLEPKLAKFNPDKLEDAEKESWYHLQGIIPFRQGNRPLAFERFQEGLRHCPDSGCILFSLGQEHEFRGETDQMFACFDKAVFPKVTSNYALAEARYAYLWSRTDKGRSYLEPLMPVYYDLKILDSMFLFMRGLPFFEQTWAYLAAFSQLEGDFEKLIELTHKAESKCEDFDFEFLKAELEGFRSGDFSALKERLPCSIQESKKNNSPTGYQTMRLNVLLAQEVNHEQEANQLVDSVTLTVSDFPWLDDIRLLAKCEQACEAGNTTQEAVLRKQFLSRQPMLFEPDHAINFNLLKYQENLMNEFRRTRPGGPSTS